MSGLYAVKEFLPLNLLLFKTFLPFFVLILFLKPCSFALCLTLGCNVCFILYSPPLFLCANLNFNPRITAL